MILEELLDVINDNCVIRLYDCNQNVIGMYDGKENISEEFNEWTVWDIFADEWTVNGKKTRTVIGIEIDYEIDFESEDEEYDYE